MSSEDANHDEASADVATLATNVDEEVKVFNWRVEQFTKIGFDQHTSFYFATDPAISISEARKLHAKHCPLSTIAQIIS